MPTNSSSKPLAYLKEWESAEGEKRSRVDLHPDCETWLKHYRPHVTPLYARPAVETTEPQISTVVERILRDLIAHERSRRENGPALVPLGNIARRAEELLRRLPVEPAEERQEGTVYSENVECSNCHAITAVQSVSPFRVLSIECPKCGQQTLAKQIDMSTVKASAYDSSGRLREYWPLGADGRPLTESERDALNRAADKSGEVLHAGIDATQVKPSCVHARVTRLSGHPVCLECGRVLEENGSETTKVTK